MVSRGNFDNLIKQEQRSQVQSLRNQDGGENARDRVARRLNVKSGKNPNPRTSTAYKPESDTPASRKGTGAKSKSSKGGGSRSSSPRSRDPGLPSSAPTPTPRGDPASLPVVDTGGDNMLPLLIPMIMAAIQRRGGGAAPAGAGDAAAAGTEVAPFKGYGGPEPTSVPLQRVPNDPEAMAALPQRAPPDALGLPQQLALPYYPGQTPPTPNDLDANAGRFFNEGELKTMQEAMPGVVKSPGWGPRVRPNEFPKGVRP